MFFYVIYRKSDFKILGFYFQETECLYYFNLLPDKSNVDWKAISFSVLTELLKGNK